MARLADWPRRYRETVDALWGTPFKWGEHDCITFAAAVASAVTGVDYLAAVKERYSWASALEARRAVDEAGGLEAMINEFLGPSGAWGLCQQGDVILAANRDGAEIVTVLDVQYLLAPEDQHLGGLPLSCALSGWRL